MTASRLIWKPALTARAISLRIPCGVAYYSNNHFLKRQLICRRKSGGGFDPYVSNAIKSQHSTNTLEEEAVEQARPLSKAAKADDPQNLVSDSDIKAEELRQWQWAVAEEMMPDSKESRISEILEEVGRMEVWLDSVADRAKVVKEKLDDMEEEGGVVLHMNEKES
jgi:hypothetical protein